MSENQPQTIVAIGFLKNVTHVYSIFYKMYANKEIEEFSVPDLTIKSRIIVSFRN